MPGFWLAQGTVRMQSLGSTADGLCERMSLWATNPHHTVSSCHEQLRDLPIVNPAHAGSSLNSHIAPRTTWHQAQHPAVPLSGIADSQHLSESQYNEMLFILWAGMAPGHGALLAGVWKEGESLDQAHRIWQRLCTKSHFEQKLWDMLQPKTLIPQLFKLILNIHQNPCLLNLKFHKNCCEYMGYLTISTSFPISVAIKENLANTEEHTITTSAHSLTQPYCSSPRSAVVKLEPVTVSEYPHHEQSHLSLTQDCGLMLDRVIWSCHRTEIIGKTMQEAHRDTEAERREQDRNTGQ